MSDLVRTTPAGLWCEAGGFFIDAWRPPAGSRVIVTHAHSDHAVVGAGSYLTARSGCELLRLRLGPDAAIECLDFGEARQIGDVRVSLHPAGHVLGSAMVRIEHRGEVWVVSGDYKIQPDAASEPFELVPCHCFFSECTFGLPLYRWPDPEEVRREVRSWWAENQAAGRTSVIFGYSLGKAQRVLALLDEAQGPIFVHGAVERFLPAYAAEGVRLPATTRSERARVRAAKGRGMVIAPPSAAGSPWLRGFGDVSTAFASGWMRIRGARRRRNLDRGFVLSDHVDWPGLLETIRATGASRVGLMHGYTAPVTRWLREQGVDAFEVPTHYEGDEEGDAPGTASEEDAASGQPAAGDGDAAGSPDEGA